MAADVNGFCINLPHETGRRDHMRAQADAARLDLVFVPAVHGSELSEPFAAYGYDANRARVTKQIIPRTEIACFLSHRRARRTFLASAAPFGLILEDDVAIDPVRLWQGAGRAGLDRRPPLRRCDILRLEGPAHSLRRALYRRDELAICCCIKYTSGAQALRYNRKGAERALARTERLWLPFDIQLGRNWESGLRIFEITPFPVVLTKLPSTIGHDGKPSWPRPTLGAKLAHLRWQVGGEVARRAMFFGQCLHPLRRRFSV